MLVLHHAMEANADDKDVTKVRKQCIEKLKQTNFSVFPQFFPQSYYIITISDRYGYAVMDKTQGVL